jgi:adenylate cyclase
MLAVEHDLENLLAPPMAWQPTPFELAPFRVSRETGSESGRPVLIRHDDVPAEISQQRLAILIGDIVAYSRLVEEDAIGTVQQIRAMRRSILIPLAQRYRACTCRGFGGDGVLMGFADPAASIRCALELRRRLATLCQEIPRARRIRLRLGLSFGVGILVDGTIYGTSVNVAARLQALARPGCICVCGDLVAAAQGPIRLEFEEMGEHALKNIKHPVNVYRLVAARVA